MNMTVACPACAASAQPATRPRDVEIGRWSARVEDSFFRCATCHQEFYEPGQMNATLEKAARAVREKRGLIAPEEIRALRARYGLSQDQLEKLLRISPKTVVRWERGTVLPTQATSLLLELLSTVPAALFAIAAQRGIALRISPPPVPQLKLVEVPQGSRFTAEVQPEEGVA